MTTRLLLALAALPHQGAWADDPLARPVAGRSFDEEADRIRAAAIEAQIDAESHAFAVTARLYDDGIIDPRDTRTVLGLALSAVHSNTVAGRRGFGVFRM